ncbi:helix-turn-helix domain-containing protein [Pseudomonas syringae]|uniref:helix-turn-helix domain-containing protein n=1 Tax=Pseudomonas syringae TaxID=317 RepID=UPI0003520A5B|nr:helix-turn-helix transcriptional regulator [Pseudomonas syringae]EPF65941.1 XRE-family DNA-binding protein [Pseudomonas syringae pv. syringae SM]QWB08738.1 helix-turn-helix domain-containing protein [Pseudomonas syringae]
MTKTIYKPEHAVLLTLLKKHRKASGLTQAQCSEALGRPQSFMSDVESGTRRLDIVQLRDLCAALGIELQDLIAEFEQCLEVKSRQLNGLLK